MACSPLYFHLDKKKKTLKKNVKQKSLLQFWQRARPVRFNKRYRVIVIPVTAWRLDWWHVSTVPRRKHSKELLIFHIFTVCCSQARVQILFNISLNLERQPVILISFWIYFFLLSGYFSLVSVVCKDCLNALSSCGKAEQSGLGSQDEPPCQINQVSSIPDDLTWISLNKYS